MDSFILLIHNLIRWVVVISAVVAIIRSFIGWFGSKEWTDMDRKVGLIYTISIDIQILLGLLLYFFFSDITKGVFSDFSSAMSVEGIRFFAIEHALLMLLGVVFAHLGSYLPKKVDDSKSKYRRAAIWYTLSVVVILLGTPWMRPLFPGMG
jgi:hypothetical protein